MSFFLYTSNSSLNVTLQPANKYFTFLMLYICDLESYMHSKARKIGALWWGAEMTSYSNMFDNTMLIFCTCVVE